MASPHDEKPWVRQGVKLGFIRNGVYYIRRSYRGKQYRPSTGQRTSEAAWVEYQRFEQVKAPNYRAPVGAVESTWDAAVLDFAKWHEHDQKNTPKHVESTVKELQLWGSQPGFTSIDTFTVEDIDAVLMALGRGDLTGRMVNARDKKGRFIMGKDGKPVKVKSKPPGKATRNRYLAALTVLMNWAREKNRTTNLADTKVHQIREGKKKESKFPVPLEAWQAVGEKLIRKWSLAQVVLVGSGMRYGELAAMRSEHLQKSKGNGAIEIPEAKGRVGRIVPVSKVVFEAAQELLEIRAKGEAKSEDEEKDDRESPFIPDDEGVQMGDRIESACARAGVRRYTAHQLRHTYATGCLMNGMNLLEFQRRMGHADLKTTEAYLHIVQAIKGDPKDYAPV